LISWNYFTSGGVLLEEIGQLVSPEEDRRWCVYIHRNKIDNKSYIGTTQQKPERRWQNGCGYKNNPHFWRAIEKYGWDNFEHIIFANDLCQNDAAHIEMLLIALYNTTDSAYGYNVSIGGDFSHLGIKHSAETKQKMAKKMKERFVNPENHPMYGKSHTEESKKKMSESRLNPSRETRKKMSKAKLGTYFDEYGNQCQITVCQYDTNGELINEFFGVSFASNQTVVSRSAISNCLCGLSHTAGGYIWKKSNEVITEEDIKLINSSQIRKKNIGSNTDNIIVECQNNFYG